MTGRFEHWRKAARAGLLTLALTWAGLYSGAADSAWRIGPFHRPADASPVISPLKDSTLLCPIRKQSVHWEALHTFNPAAVVRNGQVYPSIAPKATPAK